MAIKECTCDPRFLRQSRSHLRSCSLYVHPQAHISRKHRKPWWKERPWVPIGLVLDPRPKPGKGRSLGVLVQASRPRDWYKPFKTKPNKKREKRGQAKPR